MKKRRSLTRAEQIGTLREYMEEKRWTQVAFLAWLESKGIIITPQYLGDVLHGRRNAGPKFKQVFKEITGKTLVDGLIEGEKGQL
jgi:hypothetical protein